MPTFSNKLPSQTENRGYDLRRTPPDQPLRGIITCDDVIGCYTHWWGGRTVPCEDATCEACKANTPSRWHCYLSVLEAKTHDHFIFECTGKAANPLIEYKDAKGTLRDAYMIAVRPKRRRNARVEIIVKPFDTSGLIIPSPPDLIRAMAVIWQLPGKALRTNTAERGATLITTDPDILDAQRFDPADGNGRPKTRKKVKA